MTPDEKTPHSTRRAARTAPLAVTAGLAIGLGLLAAAAAAAPAPELGQRTPEEMAQVRKQNAKCLGCHADMDPDTDVLELDDGSELAVLVDEDAWQESIHGDRLACTDCHRDHGKYPHADVEAADARAYQIAAAASCTTCHYAYYTRALDGIHYQLLAEGRREAPTCVDCHGAHSVKVPGQPRTAIDGRCARCHEAIATTYRASVHGKALASGDVDVPTCTDCHGAHAIRDPRGVAFHASSHEICAQCHADKERMSRHGLNTAVISTYLKDFHGVSNQLYAAGAGLPDQPMASCVDCHGVHDIQPFDEGGGQAVVRARVEVVCARCHQDTPVGFANAWLGHYEPTLRSAPLVAGVTWGYRLLIPLIVAGLISHILLHLWRYQTHR